MPQPVNPYDTLGLQRGSSLKEIREQYRVLVKKYHPDQNPGDPQAAERIRAINSAMEMLDNSDLKSRYDHLPSAAPTITATLRNLLRRKTHFRTSLPGTSVHESVWIQHTQNGTQIPVSFKVDAPCPACTGTGAEMESDLFECDFCDATGKDPVLPIRCELCLGTGAIIADRCAECKGTGLGKQVRTLKVNIPAGMKDGALMRVTGRGNPGTHGGDPGDLIIEINIKPPKSTEEQRN